MRAHEFSNGKALVPAGAIDAQSDLALPQAAIQIAQDVEATLLVSPSAYVVLATNWDTASPAQCELRLPVQAGKLRGKRVLPPGKVEDAAATLSAGKVRLTLQPQEACLLALKKP